MLAEIKNNLVYCPNCKCELGQSTYDFDLVVHEEGEKFFEFKRKCNKCKRVYTYHVYTDFSKRITLPEESVRYVRNME